MEESDKLKIQNSISFSYALEKEVSPTSDLYVKSVSIRDSNNGEVLGTYEFSRLIVVYVKPYIHDFSADNLVHFELSVFPTGCTGNGDPYCELVETARADFNEFGGLWSFNLDTKEFKKDLDFPNI